MCIDNTRSRTSDDIEEAGATVQMMTAAAAAVVVVAAIQPGPATPTAQEGGPRADRQRPVR